METLRSSRNTVDIWILLAVSILAMLPVWISAYPPMSDLPQHAAQVGLLHALHHSQFKYAVLYQLNWFTPYLLGYLLIYFVTPLLGIVAACKLVVALSVVGFLLAAALLLDSAGVDIFWAILCIPGVYGFAYQWGFLNFLIAAPLGLLFLWFVRRSPVTPNWRTSIFFAVASIGLFFCHALVCGFFGLCAVLYLLQESPSLRIAVKRILPLAAVVPVAALWMKRTMAHPAARRPVVWDLGWFNTIEGYYSSLSEELHFHSSSWGRITGFFPRLFGVYPSWRPVLVGIILFLMPLLAGMRFNKRSVAWAPFLLCVAVLLFCPHTVFGTDFVYQRFVIFIFPLFLLLLRPSVVLPKTLFVVRFLTLGLVLGVIYMDSMKAVVFSRETRGFQAALAYMEPGQRVLSLAFDHGDGVSISPTFIHFPQWYGAQKQGVVDPSAAMMHPELVIYRTGEIPEAVLWDFEWDPEEFNWDDYSAEQYRYFVVRSKDDVGATLFSHAPCPVPLRFHQEEWWLYERVDCGASSSRLITRPSR